MADQLPIVILNILYYTAQWVYTSHEILKYSKYIKYINTTHISIYYSCYYGDKNKYVHVSLKTNKYDIVIIFSLLEF